MGGGIDDGVYNGTEALVGDGRRVAYLDRNGSKRNSNLNWMYDDWNGNYRFLAVRNFYYFSRATCTGVLFVIPSPTNPFKFEWVSWGWYH